MNSPLPPPSPALEWVHKETFGLRPINKLPMELVIRGGGAFLYLKKIPGCLLSRLGVYKEFPSKVHLALSILLPIHKPCLFYCGLL